MISSEISFDNLCRLYYIDYVSIKQVRTSKWHSIYLETMEEL